MSETCKLGDTVMIPDFVLKEIMKTVEAMADRLYDAIPNCM